MSAHIHHKLMALYAQDAAETDKPWERWQYRGVDGDIWFNAKRPIKWLPMVQYRRKPKTININGRELPEPIKEQLNYGAIYYLPNLRKTRFNILTWLNDDFDHYALKKGIVCRTKEDAIAYADAFLSFTEN